MPGLLQLERGHKFWAPETARLQPYSYQTLHRNPSKVSTPTFPVFMHKNNVVSLVFKVDHTPMVLNKIVIFACINAMFHQEKTEFQNSYIF